MLTTEALLAEILEEKKSPVGGDTAAAWELCTKVESS
jgi:hypothetical protein